MARHLPNLFSSLSDLRAPNPPSQIRVDTSQTLRKTGSTARTKWQPLGENELDLGVQNWKGERLFILQALLRSSRRLLDGTSGAREREEHLADAGVAPQAGPYPVTNRSDQPLLTVGAITL